MHRHIISLNNYFLQALPEQSVNPPCRTQEEEERSVRNSIRQDIIDWSRSSLSRLEELGGHERQRMEMLGLIEDMEVEME